MRATLMKVTAQGIVVQLNTRVPEPPFEIPVAQLARVTLDQGGTSPGKAIGIGIVSQADIATRHAGHGVGRCGSPLLPRLDVTEALKAIGIAE
jgi:hypothetical protein